MENIPKLEEPSATTERLAYSVQESALVLGVSQPTISRMMPKVSTKKG